MEKKYVVSIDQLGKRRKYVYASSSLSQCRDYVQRKYRGCRLTRKSDIENDEDLVEKYVQVFNRTIREKIIIIIRIKGYYIDDAIIKEEINNESE